jgi:hypothetical protein
LTAVAQPSQLSMHACSLFDLLNITTNLKGIKKEKKPDQKNMPLHAKIIHNIIITPSI